MKTFSLFLLFLTLVTVACSSSKSTATASEERDGSSFEKAIIARSISAEYEWLRLHYPGSKPVRQSLVENDGKHYDVLSIEFPDGTKKDVYFDINSFYGKKRIPMRFK